MKCPICSSELLEVGYAKDFVQHYKCPKGCRFDKTLTWKLRSALNHLIAITLTLGMAITLLPLRAMLELRKLISKIRKAEPYLSLLGLFLLFLAGYFWNTHKEISISLIATSAVLAIAGLENE